MAETNPENTSTTESECTQKFPLHKVAEDGDFDKVHHLVLQGEDITAKNDKGLMVLHCAAKSGKRKVVDFLISQGADVNCKTENGSNPLIVCAADGKMEMVKYFVSLGTDVHAKNKSGWNVLHRASLSTNTDLVDYLVSLGLDVNEKTLDKGHTPLLISSQKGNMDMVKCLIRLGADINSRDNLGRNVLHHASLSTNPDLVEYLVRHGLDVNVKTKADNTPFDISLLYRNDDMVSFWTSNITLPNTKQDSLRRCTCLGYTYGARLLLDAGVDPNNCLKQSCRNGNIDITRLLLLKGGNPNSRCKFGVGAFEIIPFSKIIDYQQIFSFSRKQMFDCKIENISHIPGIGNVKEIPDLRAQKVHKAVLTFFQMLNSGKMLNGFKLKPCGSTAEGCRVGLPNEMDILFQCKEKICTSTVSRGYGYVQCSGQLSSRVEQGSKAFHQSFYKRLELALISIHVKGIYVNHEGQEASLIKEQGRKACTPILIEWRDEPNRLCVSVDAVPCVHIDGWSNEFVTQTWLMDINELTQRGYLLVPKPPHRKSKLARQFTDEDLDELWKVSFPHLEVEHINSLEDRIKDVYITAKCLRNPDVCRIMITEGEGLPKNVDDYISSYFLKSIFLKNVDDFRGSYQSLGEMVCKVYDDLDDALHKDPPFIPTFFAPKYNVLDGLKLDVAKSAKVASIMKAFVRRLHCQGENANIFGVVPAETEAGGVSISENRDVGPIRRHAENQSDNRLCAKTEEGKGTTMAMHGWENDPVADLMETQDLGWSYYAIDIVNNQSSRWTITNTPIVDTSWQHRALLAVYQQYKWWKYLLYEHVSYLLLLFQLVLICFYIQHNYARTIIHETWDFQQQIDSSLFFLLMFIQQCLLLNIELTKILYRVSGTLFKAYALPILSIVLVLVAPFYDVCRIPALGPSDIFLITFFTLSTCMLSTYHISSLYKLRRKLKSSLSQSGY